jgi:hypothetical protein
MKEEEIKDIDGGDEELPEFMAENIISIAFGDVSVSVGGDASFDELENRLFGIIDRMDKRFGCNKNSHEHDVV